VPAIKTVVDRLCEGTLRCEEVRPALVLAGNLPPVSLRRPEMFTGAGRRRRWSDEDKARIVAEIGERRLGLFSSPTAWIVAAAVVWLATSVAKSRERSFRSGRSTVRSGMLSAFKFWTPNDNPHHASASGDARQRSWGTGDDDARRQNDEPCRSGCQDFGQQQTLAPRRSRKGSMISTSVPTRYCLKANGQRRQGP
jgi:hypothetical protein